jgi:hypothetical protein
VANFPINPGISSIFTDTTSGFRYKWTGTVWKSFTPSAGNDVKKLDDISSGFDNSTTTFALTLGGVAVIPVNAQSLTVSLGGVVQEPGTDYTVSGSNITFTTAPNSGLDFFAINRATATDIITKTGVLDNLIVSGMSTQSSIQATNLNVSGVSTFSTISQLNVTGVSTLTSLIVGSAITMSAEAIDGGRTVRILGENLNVVGVATAQDFDSLSDINFKDNVITVGGALDKINELRGVSFNWKETGESSYGVIAQELETVLPELVHGNDPKTVNYNGIIGVLIEAVKELKAEVDSLKE